MKKLRIFTGLALVLASTIAPISWVASAYATNLTRLGVVSPDGAFNISGKTPMKTPGKKATVFTRAVPLGSTTNKFTGTIVVNAETFMTRLVSSVETNQHRLLWSAYPASIRGQVFSNNVPGGNPLETSGW
ncbi:MAG TPA: hypothetical protein V6C89_20845 [Drouetiella sp.]|jgi:hypothetical protein